MRFFPPGWEALLYGRQDARRYKNRHFPLASRHFALQSPNMKTDQAAEQLQTIRTLMERSALYRRALAPIMTYAGLMGILAAAAGLYLRVGSQTEFIGYWLAVAIAGVAGAFVLVRRQALKKAEPFWSPPTRRVAQALLPPLSVGLFLGICVYYICTQATPGNYTTSANDGAGILLWMPAIWAVFYGCALHSAGFCVSRGLRLFGWVFITAGCAIMIGLVMMLDKEVSELAWEGGHWLMGILFGLLQLAYGLYLFATGEEQNAL